MDAKKIIITGSATRIGAALALSLAKHGAQLYTTINQKKKLEN